MDIPSDTVTGLGPVGAGARRHAWCAQPLNDRTADGLDQQQLPEWMTAFVNHFCQRSA
jgi:hypothetical protein